MKTDDPELRSVIFPGEAEAVAQMLIYADRYGYGNLISRLQEAWKEKLVKTGMDQETASMASWEALSALGSHRQATVEH